MKYIHATVALDQAFNTDPEIIKAREQHRIPTDEMCELTAALAVKTLFPEGDATPSEIEQGLTTWREEIEIKKENRFNYLLERFMKGEVSNDAAANDNEYLTLAAISKGIAQVREFSQAATS